MAVLEAVFCYISGCSPNPEDTLRSLARGEFGPQVLAALKLLASPDETEGQQALSVIGLFNGKVRQSREDFLSRFEDALSLPKERFHVINGCRMGGSFMFGFLQHDFGQDELVHVYVARSTCFYVITTTLPILEAATGGRITPHKLWLLVLSKGHLQGDHSEGIKGVNYGPLLNSYRRGNPWLFGRCTNEDIQALESRGTPEEIAEILRSVGYWLWMRPDRFPIDATCPSQVPPSNLSTTTSPKEPAMQHTLSELPIELLFSILSHLSLPDIVAVASSSKSLYYELLATPNARDSIAKTHMHSCARWCLPHGEAELKWWNERNGNDALGWEYMVRCYNESHSMRNRRRIWRAAESIEEEYNKEDAKWAEMYGWSL